MQDVIEDQVDIDADAERVWRLVSEPGWWINDGEYREHVVDERADRFIVTDAAHGAFAITLDRADPPRHVAFRWLRDPDGPADGVGTLTEFWIEDRPGGVTLRVRESGFASLGLDALALRRSIDDNVEGWSIELEVARTHAESR